ncbi:MAG: pilus assembly protein PilM [Candidatus Kerfeldbacteria bacterium]|nr:pilus assembly protein PilM [Candidatus Kerfeldbacteria bacterium]
MFIGNQKLNSVGVDMSDHVIRIVGVQQQGKKKRVTHFGQQLLPDGMMVNGIIHNQDAVIKTITNLLSTTHIRRHRTIAVVSLPEYHGFIKTIHLQDEPIEKEIQKHLPFPETEVTIDTVRDDHTLSFAAVKTDIAMSYAESVEAAGLHVGALEIESQAIARLFIPREKIPETIVLADIGRNHTTILVVTHGRIDFTHTSKFISGKMLTEAIAKTLNVSEAEAEKMKMTKQEDTRIHAVIQEHTTLLSNELKRVIHFHQEHTAEQEAPQYVVYLIGGGSKIDHIRQYLEEYIHYPVQQAKMAEPIVIPDTLQSELLSYGTAIGLAIRTTTLF